MTWMWGAGAVFGSWFCAAAQLSITPALHIAGQSCMRLALQVTPQALSNELN